jgi:hypothetical protein
MTVHILSSFVPRGRETSRSFEKVMMLFMSDWIPETEGIFHQGNELAGERDRERCGQDIRLDNKKLWLRLHWLGLGQPALASWWANARNSRGF